MRMATESLPTPMKEQMLFFVTHATNNASFAWASEPLESTAISFREGAPLTEQPPAGQEPFLNEFPKNFGAAEHQRLTKRG